MWVASSRERPVVKTFVGEVRIGQVSPATSSTVANRNVEHHHGLTAAGLSEISILGPISDKTERRQVVQKSSNCANLARLWSRAVQNKYDNYCDKQQGED